ncbi:SET domain-containing protein, partial [Durusdinium trenchii]
VAILDKEWQDEVWADCSSADTTALGIALARSFSSSLDAVLKPFHPQEPTRNSSAESEDEDEDALEGMKEATSSAWQQLSQLSQVAQQRLQEVVRLNALGFYTHSEQLCHNSNFLPLTGSGLFALASGFNHSCEPSVQRYSIGDVTAFVTNQKVDAGTELCITYIESELLCAPKSLRSQSLNRDFSCSCRACGRADPVVLGGSRTFIRVDAQVQARLALLPPQERVEAIDAALEGQMDGEEAEEEQLELDEVDGGEDPQGPKTVLLGKDAQELRVVQAIAFMHLCRWEEALQNWRRLAAFTCHHCPPYDEALAVYATQAALCALEMKREDAPLYVNHLGRTTPLACERAHGATASMDSGLSSEVRLAVEAHRMAFGLECLTWRYQREVEESMVSKEVKEAFWSRKPSRSFIRL